MTATVIVCFAAAAAEHGGSATLTFAAAGCFAVMLAMTLALNMPINLAVFGWDEEHGDPDRWRQLRRRWDRIHTARVLLGSARLRPRQRRSRLALTAFSPQAPAVRAARSGTRAGSSASLALDANAATAATRRSRANTPT
jgi:hypothetical protein